jgi:hypothetical protein
MDNPSSSVSIVSNQDPSTYGFTSTFDPKASTLIRKPLRLASVSGKVQTQSAARSPESVCRCREGVVTKNTTIETKRHNSRPRNRFQHPAGVRLYPSRLYTSSYLVLAPPQLERTPPVSTITKMPVLCVNPTSMTVSRQLSYYPPHE